MLAQPTTENSIEVPQNIKNIITILSSNSTSGYLSEGNRTHSLEKTYVPLCSLQHHL